MPKDLLRIDREPYGSQTPTHVWYTKHRGLHTPMHAHISQHGDKNTQTHPQESDSHDLLTA